MKESQLHTAFSKWLDTQGICYIHSRTDKRSHTTKGDPDYVCWLAGRAIGVELKILGGKLSPVQVKRIAQLRAAGNVVHVCFDLESAIDAVLAWSGVCNAAQGLTGTQKGLPDSCLKEADGNAGNEPITEGGNPELGPCPFCGDKEPYLEVEFSHHDKVMDYDVFLARVFCRNMITCEASIGQYLNDEQAARANVIRQWNTRRAPSVPSGNENSLRSPVIQKETPLDCMGPVDNGTDLRGSTEGRATKLVSQHEASVVASDSQPVEAPLLSHRGEVSVAGSDPVYHQPHSENQSSSPQNNLPVNVQAETKGKAGEATGLKSEPSNQAQESTRSVRARKSWSKDSQPTDTLSGGQNLFIAKVSGREALMEGTGENGTINRKVRWATAADKERYGKKADL